MHIVCSYSSLSFTCEHFPGNLDHRETCHPVFHLPQRKLLSYLGRWSEGALTPTDNYLLFLAILKSSDLVEFRVPAIQTNQTQSLIALHMEALCKIVSRLNTVTNPAVIFPRYVITPDTKTLSNVEFWINNWFEAYEDFKSGKLKEYDDRKLVHRERALERLIKNPHRPVASYASQIGEWAATAADFPTFIINSPFSGAKISCADYWKLLITRCASEEQLFSIPKKDLEELLEHCETNIPIGSIYSNALFKILRHAIKRQENFLGLGDLDITRSTYEILNSTDSVEDANLRAMIQAAPESAPTPAQYPNKLAYLRAKMRYEMSRKYSQGQDSDDGPINSKVGEL
jgi:hypothetical protein